MVPLYLSLRDLWRWIFRQAEFLVFCLLTDRFSNFPPSRFFSFDFFPEVVVLLAPRFHWGSYIFRRPPRILTSIFTVPKIVRFLILFKLLSLSEPPYQYLFATTEKESVRYSYSLFLPSTSKIRPIFRYWFPVFNFVTNLVELNSLLNFERWWMSYS